MICETNKHNSVTLELDTEANRLCSDDTVFLEGELFDNIITFWHIKVPCIYDNNTCTFKASVEVQKSGKFNFYKQKDGQKTQVLSSLYPVEEEYDGSKFNVYRTKRGDAHNGTINAT